MKIIDALMPWMMLACAVVGIYGGLMFLIEVFVW
jgi:hypothetical protein